MTVLIFAVAAALLSIERICYIWAWRYPESFRAFCALPGISSLGLPVSALQTLFYGFKAIQLFVFFGWCLFFGQGSILPLAGSLFSFGLGAVLIATGQFLSASVFWRLGETGVFYGNRYGYEIPWCSEFPFSLLKHPQYAGTLLSIWGFFLVMRFPRPDWLVLPTLETAYYIAGAYLEQ